MEYKRSLPINFEKEKIKIELKLKDLPNIRRKTHDQLCVSKIDN